MVNEERSERSDRVIPVDQTTGTLIWAGVEEDPAEVARLQPPWDVSPIIAVKADVGHHFRAPEVIRWGKACARAGASALHIHIRDDDGVDSGDMGLWKEVLADIKGEFPDILIDSSPRGDTFEEQMSHIKLGMFDIVPIATTWHPEYVARCAQEVYDNGATLEIDVWDGTDITLATKLIRDGVIRQPASWLLVPSAPYYGIPMRNPMSGARGLIHMIELVRDVDPDGLISVSASGRPSSYLTALSTILGQQVRPGLGESPFRYPHRDVDDVTSEVLVEDAVTVARALGREPATSPQHRQMLGL